MMREAMIDIRLKLSSSQQTNAALTADRKRLEAEVRRLQAIVDSRSLDATPLRQLEILRSCNRREMEMTSNPLEMKVTTEYWQKKYEEEKRLHELESKVAADQVASLQRKLEQTAVNIRDSKTLLEEARRELQVHQRATAIYDRDIADLKAQLEGARARAVQEAEEASRKNSNLWPVGSAFSNSPLFNHFIEALGYEIIVINTNNGWDVTKPSDWPSAPGTPDSENTHRLRKIGTNLALIHSEVSEALEAVRKLDRQNFEEELADVIIRVLDTSHGLGINLGPVISAKLEKNRGRGHRHGGKAI